MSVTNRAHALARGSTLRVGRAERPVFNRHVRSCPPDARTSSSAHPIDRSVRRGRLYRLARTGAHIGGSARDRPEALTTLGDMLLKGHHRD
jgi:hypothetical protein